MDMSRTIKFCVAAASLAVAALSADAMAQQYRPEPPAALYRQGQPMVLTPPPAPNPNAANNASVAAFREWNRRAGNPSMVVFWARSFTDDATSDFESYFAQAITATPWELSNVAVAGRQATTDSRDQRIGLRMSEALQASFMNTLINAGGRVMDRAALMRKASLKATSGNIRDKQHLETLAMEQGVQYLIEIVPDYKLSSPTDLTFLVKVTHLPTSTVRAQFATDAKPPSDPARYVANSNGFQKVIVTRMTVENVGAQIAYDTIAKLN
jgi:hypothetical protein